MQKTQLIQTKDKRQKTHKASVSNYSKRSCVLMEPKLFKGFYCEQLNSVDWMMISANDFQSRFSFNSSLTDSLVFT